MPSRWVFPAPPPARAQNTTKQPDQAACAALAWCLAGRQLQVLTRGACRGLLGSLPGASCTPQRPLRPILIAPLQRAREYLDKIPGGVGAYSESKGATILRQASPRCPALPARPARCPLTKASPALHLTLMHCGRCFPLLAIRQNASAGVPFLKEGLTRPLPSPCASRSPTSNLNPNTPPTHHPPPRRSTWPRALRSGTVTPATTRTCGSPTAPPPACTT